MRNTKMGRPPIPDTWGSENASPTRSYELIRNESVMFQPKYIPDHDELLCCSRDYSPTAEFLQMTERLIKSKSLSHRDSKTLKNLYVRYKSIKGYGSTEIVHMEKSKNGSAKGSSSALKQSCPYPGIEIPSTSKENETSSIESSESDEVDEKSVQDTRMLDETEQHQIQPLTVEDINLEHTCDPDIFKIVNVFSDFSLRDIGLETRFKKKIKKWATKQRRELLQSSSRENQQSNIPVDNQPDQHI